MTLIGRGDRLGTVEKGKLAELITVQGNPIDRMSAMREIRLVTKDGVRYDTLSWRWARRPEPPDPVLTPARRATIIRLL